MKTPLDMLHDIVAQISEGNTLLEMIYRNTEEMNEETDCGLACLIRSFDKTRETAYAYIEELANTAKTVNPPPIGNRDDIADDIFYATVSAAKLRELAHVYNESYFSGKDSDDADCLMASLIFDNTIKVHELLKSIEIKLN
ncbi:TPA: hypothetical protein PEQ97_000554 [Enterobacter hormaechei]|uniref:hypothetical protein n=1 Tax=Enterobacteriaceae TaxID=543 RepID=UPI0003381533|nr:MULTISPECIES: hypothetical protein [Enterobacteriaceae]EAZ0187136.1 hypothetical protein [Salmonella enterica]GJK12552.1 hypothetical protein TUM16664_03240 [Enterobacter cloacae]EEW9263412.1 hypothetical protein [Escherichia coli]EFD0309634.1 hypothetical protein [Escherichia coli]EIY4398935.1 hypothetical protein [Escherichia coli]